jgi:hypothetical protein
VPVPNAAALLKFTVPAVTVNPPPKAFAASIPILHLDNTNFVRSRLFQRRICKIPISSPDKSGYGSLIELCWGGKETINLPSGEERKFLVDGDEINLTGECKGNGFTIGFGDCRGKVLPSLDDSNYF